ncbi:uncharacterized protein F4822DRAFT_431842 [Hypoxylon trugodes]|uniref:uncharacterized protein n=1 Tax=Hypoxylon trugodes TaxID=326681 RepID=UPI0021A0EBEB|nr:uncharacterized protein F4822DRAFT_431842 [Hypoxylon trugodes]KAI1386974.1 hypothetical protein F4822DRAFT_431842 [Hypoxylon trugodes]
MEKTDPTSPVPSSSNIKPSNTTADDVVFQSQIQQLIQHNASVSSVDAQNQINSSTQSRYSSPAPQQQQQQTVIPTYDHESPYAANAPTPTYGSGYHQPSYQMEPSPYPQLPDTGSSLTPHNTYSTPATSPPTPSQADSMMTRSGRSITRAHGATPILGPQIARVMKTSPKPRAGGAAARKAARKRRNKGEDDDGKPLVVLDEPLSVVVREMTGVRDTNIEEYVNRPLETRQAEVRDSKEGKVKRPMNAFMLYRKAYQNRAKEYKKHDNHQVISRICGVSWGMESQELREQFDNWAKIERENHKLAFPEYKFAPAKAKNKKGINAGGGGRGRDSDDDGSDLEGYEWDISTPPSRNNTRSARSMYDQDAEYRPPGVRSYAPYPHHRSPVSHHTQIPYSHQHQQAYAYPNTKPRPVDYGTSLGQSQYYHQPTNDYMRAYQHSMQVPQPYAPVVHDVMYGPRMTSPASSFHGSPVDQYGNLMGSGYPPPPPQSQAQVMQAQVAAMPQPRMNDYQQQHHQIDPSLMGPQHGSQFDALNILGIGDQNDALGQYSLDQGTLGGNSHHQQHQPQQHFDQSFHHTHPDDHGLGTSGAWHDDPTTSANEGLAKLGDEWETLAEGNQFHLDSIDDILGTTDSPGG